MVLSLDAVIEQKAATDGGFLLSCSSTLSTVVIWVILALIYRIFVSDWSGAAAGACWWQVPTKQHEGQESSLVALLVTFNAKDEGIDGERDTEIPQLLILATYLLRFQSTVEE